MALGSCSDNHEYSPEMFSVWVISYSCPITNTTFSSTFTLTKSSSKTPTIWGKERAAEATGAIGQTEKQKVYHFGEVDSVRVEPVSQMRVQLKSWCNLHNLQKKKKKTRVDLESLCNSKTNTCKMFNSLLETWNKRISLQTWDHLSSNLI